jgi:hypothetical protein
MKMHDIKIMYESHGLFKVTFNTGDCLIEVRRFDCTE